MLNNSYNNSNIPNVFQILSAQQLLKSINHFNSKLGEISCNNPLHYLQFNQNHTSNIHKRPNITKKTTKLHLIDENSTSNTNQ